MGTHHDSCLTAAELAQRLHVKTPTVLRWHRAGKIPAVRITAKVLRFDLVDVLAALKRPTSDREVSLCRCRH
jgi:excisionase family DNA binding protein